PAPPAKRSGIPERRLDRDARVASPPPPPRPRRRALSPRAPCRSPAQPDPAPCRTPRSVAHCGAPAAARRECPRPAPARMSAKAAPAPAAAARRSRPRPPPPAADRATRRPTARATQPTPSSSLRLIPLEWPVIGVLERPVCDLGRVGSRQYRQPREGLGDRTLVSIEQRQLERHPERALGVEGAPGVFAYPIAAPGIGRGDVKLRPAPGDFTLQAELRQVVLTQRVRDLGPPDQ